MRSDEIGDTSGRPRKARPPRRFASGVLTAIVAVLAGGAASAEDAWRFTLSPYFWAAGLSGEVATLPGQPPADTDLDFGDILEDLRFGGMLAATAHRGRFGLLADLQYVETVSDGATPGPAFSGVELTSKTFIGTLIGEYRVLDGPGHALHLGAGLRVWSVDNDLSLAAGALPGRSVGGSDTWVDPVLSARGTVDLGARVFLAGSAAVGGFGAGSEMMADLFGVAGYRITPALAATAGYRWMMVDRDADGFLYDVRQQGPMLGLTYAFGR